MNIKLGSIYCDDLGILIIPIEKLRLPNNYACIALHNGHISYRYLIGNYHLATKYELERITSENIHLTIIGIFSR